MRPDPDETGTDGALPWIRGNDRMPSRSAKSYTRIPIEPATGADDDAEPAATEPPLAVEPPAASDARGPAPAGQPPRPPEPPPNRPGPTPPADAPARPAEAPGPARDAAGRRPGAGPAGLILLGVAALLIGLGLSAVAGISLLSGGVAEGILRVACFAAGVAAFPAGRWLIGLARKAPPGDAWASTRRRLRARLELREIAARRGTDEDAGRAADALRRFLRGLPAAPELAGDLAADPGLPPRDWLRAFDARVADPLDDRAGETVEAHAWRAFVSALRSPSDRADAVSTYGAGRAMLGELAGVYGLPIGRGGRALLLNSLLLEDASAPARIPDALPADFEVPPVVGDLRPWLDRHFRASNAGALVVSARASGLDAFGPRIDTALLQYALIWRIGRLAIGRLRPVDRDA